MKRIIFLILMMASIEVNLFAQAPIDLGTSETKALAPRKFLPVSGILGAFPEEIKLLLTQVLQKKETVIQSIVFTEGLLHGKKVVVAQTGIGKVNAAITSTLMIEHFQPREIIFTGIAGGINPDLHGGDLVIGTRIAHHDFGTLTPDSLLRRPTRHPSTMRENPLYFLCDSTLIALAIRAGKNAKMEPVLHDGKSTSPRVVTGTIVTGDVFVASTIATQNLRSKMNADATEMEGAAVAQVCFQQRVPFVIIRSISDSANNSASSDIKNFYQTAAKNSAALVIEMVSEMKN